jgi:hypothetical protein
MERSFKTSTARASWHDQGPAGSVGRYRESGVEGVEPVDRSSMLPRAYRLPQAPSCRRSRAPSHGPQSVIVTVTAWPFFLLVTLTVEPKGSDLLQVRVLFPG